MIRRMRDMKKLLRESQNKLNQLLQDPHYTIEYIKEQWNRQRECQLRVIGSDSIQALTEKLAHLVDLEENLHEAQSVLELRDLRRKRRRTRSQADEQRILRLPDTLTIIEEQIDLLIDELGSDEFRNVPGANSNLGRALIRLQVSKGRLYEAKVGVLEEAKQESQLRKKFVTFERQVLAFNGSFPDATPMECPEFNEVKSTPIEDRFWDFGRLTHPEEAWAKDVKLQDGIKWYLEVTHSEDELRRIGRECRQSIEWAIKTYKKLMDLKEVIFSRNDSLDDDNNKWVMELVTPNKTHCLRLLLESREVLIALFSNEIQMHTRLWMTWNCGISRVLSGTSYCTNLPVADEAFLKTSWTNLMRQVNHIWGDLTQARVIQGEEWEDGMEEAEDNPDDLNVDGVDPNFVPF
ncbi:hypothetical protein DFH28DRAFT_904324 [Melampsora americana]|nr:hypothetical protein DFH28DRAFT_904324 [Melampsora americana]